jgi:hypothetical protein
LTFDVRHDSLDVMAATDPGVQTTTAPTAAESPLAAIATARGLAAQADAALQQAVDDARSAGHSWREIGVMLDTSRQAAFQRFGRPVDPRTGTPLDRAVPPGLVESAVAIFADMAAGRWEDARSSFSEALRARLDAERLGAGWIQTIGMIGNFERMGQPLARPVNEDTVVHIKLYFEAGERLGLVTLDQHGQILGLSIRPVPAREEPAPTVERE